METLINKGYLPSRMSKIGTELWWKYTERRISPFVALGLVFWVIWIAQISWATGQLAFNIVYFLY